MEFALVETQRAASQNTGGAGNVPVETQNFAFYMQH
jgi:hypothetical protein